MQKLVNMGHVIDLLGVLYQLPKANARITAVCRILNEIPVPYNYRNAPVNGEVKWVQVGLMFGNLTLFENECADNAVLERIRCNSDTQIFYGCANVAMPADYACYLQNANKDIIVEGKIYAEKSPNTGVSIVTWSKDLLGSGWQVNAVMLHPLDLSGYSDGIKALYTKLQRNSMRDVLHTLYDLSGIVPCSLGQKAVFTEVVEKQDVVAYWDTQTDSIVPLSEQERVALVSTPDLSIVSTNDETDEVNLGEDVIQTGRYRYNRFEFLENTAFVAQLQDVVNQKKQQLREMSVSAVGAVPMQGSIAERFAEHIVAGIKKEWAHVSEGGGTLGVLTGAELLESVLCDAADDGFMTGLTHYIGNVGETGLLAKMKVQISMLMGERVAVYKILQYWLDTIKHGDVPMIDTVELQCAYSDCNTAFINALTVHICDKANSYLLMFLKKILHIGGSLIYANSRVQAVGKTIWDFMKNPYELAYYGVYMNITDFDILALVMGCFKRENVQKARMVMFVRDMLHNASDNIVRGSTVVAYNTLVKSLQYKTYVSSTEVKSMQITHMHLTAVQRLAAKLYLGVAETEYNYGLDNLYTVDKIGNTYYKLCGYSAQIVLQEFENSPIGVVLMLDGIKMLTDLDFLCGELFCYEKSRSLASAGKVIERIEESTIETYTKVFERQLAEELNLQTVELEYMQREALKCVNSTLAAIVGGPGTGKTTLASLLIEIQQKVRGIVDDEVLFVAPTGKAATRLKESVKRPTMTIHRACALTKDKENTGRSLDRYKIIVVDECSMISLDLMRTLLSAIGVGTFVYLLGDIAQLTAIDSGKPFADMLHYIPCVTLETSKRAAKGSLITKNSDILVNSVTAPLYKGSNYIIADIAEAQAQEYIADICKYHLYGESNRMREFVVGAGSECVIGSINDIMVITPVKNEHYAWGSTALNKVLQPIFNKATDSAPNVYCKNREGEITHRYYVGDKVVHLVNWSDEVRYIRADDETFKVYGKEKDFVGVMNGEIGIVRYIVDGTEVVFGERETEETSISVQLQKKRAKKVYMFVEYSDVDVETQQAVQYLICYPLVKKYDEEMEQNGYCVEAESMRSLDSAYAMTVHKLQGSQAKITICLCYGVRTKDFISNNLLQTMLTRASGGLYLIGDIKGAFTEARKVNALKLRKTVFDWY